MIDDQAMVALAWLGGQPALVALAALLLDRIVPRWRARSRLARGLTELARRLNRLGRDEALLRRRAFALWLLVTGLGAAAGAGVALVIARVGAVDARAGAATGLLVMTWAIAYRPARATALRAVGGVHRMAKRQPPSAVKAVAETGRLRLARRFSDGAVAFVLAWLLFGPVVALAVKASQSLAEATDSRRSSPFGQVVQTCHGLLTIIPCWVAATVISGNRRLPPFVLPPRLLVEALGRPDGEADDPAAGLVAASRAVERGWRLWFVVLALAGAAAAGLG